MARKKTSTTARQAPAERLHGPTPDRARRGEDLHSYTDAGLPQHRIRGGLQALYEAGGLDQAQHNAGTKWRRDFEFGLHNANDPSPGGGGGDLCRDDYRLLALGRWRRSVAALQPDQVLLLELFAVECLSFSSAARLVACARARHAEDRRMSAERAAGHEPTRHLTPLPHNGARQASQQPALDGLPRDRETLKTHLIDALSALHEHYEAEERIRRAVARAKLAGATLPAAMR